MSTPIQNKSQQAKRKNIELSPDMETDLVGNMKITDLMNVIKETITLSLDEKMKNLSTKADMEEIKQEIGAVNTELLSLRKENLELKEEIAILKKEKQVDRKNVLWLEQQTCNKKLIFKGVSKDSNPKKAVHCVCSDILKIDIGILSARKMFERDEKMSVIVELETSAEVAKVFKNTSKLAGTKISIERYILPLKQERKKAFLQLKKNISNISKKHKIVVRDDRLKVNDKWFIWNSENKLVCGKINGREALKDLYEEDVENLEINYDTLLQNFFSKN